MTAQTQVWACVYVCLAYCFDGSAFFIFVTETRETGVSAKGEHGISASASWRKVVEIGLKAKVD